MGCFCGIQWQDSADMLTSEEERRMYDWSLLRLQNPGVEYIWPFEADITQRLSDSPPNKVSMWNCETNYFFPVLCWEQLLSWPPALATWQFESSVWKLIFLFTSTTKHQNLKASSGVTKYCWPLQTVEDDEGNRNVALFFLGWFILSCVLNIVLPRLPWDRDKWTHMSLLSIIPYKYCKTLALA